jgi:hypothetical protein
MHKPRVPSVRIIRSDPVTFSPGSAWARAKPSK